MYSLVGTTLPVAEAISNDTTTAVPPGVEAGDLLIWAIRTRQYSSTEVGYDVGTVPAGWTRLVSAGTIGGAANGADMAMGVYTRVATGAEPASYVAGPFGSGYQQGAMFAYRGAQIVGSTIERSLDTTTGAQEHTTGVVTLSSPLVGGEVLLLNACGWQNGIWTSGSGVELWKQDWFYGRRTTGVTATDSYAPDSAIHSADWNHEYVSVSIALTEAADPALPLALGDTVLDGMYVGADPVEAIYLGETLLWEEPLG